MEYDVVAKAKKVIEDLRVPDRRDASKLVLNLTTSQLRKILSAVSVLKNKLDVDLANGVSTKTKLNQSFADEVKFLNVVIAYQSGREPAVKKFALNAELVEIVNSIGNSTAEFTKFCKYVEALVAYHKFYGGKDK